MSRPESRARRTAHRLVLAVTALGLTLPTAVLVATPAEARTASKLSVQGPKKATAKKQITFRGKVRSDNKRRVVRVHVKAKNAKRWKPAGKVRTTKKGAFKVKVGTGAKAGKRLVRFTAPATKKFRKAQVRRVVKVRRPAKRAKGLQVTWQRARVTAGKGKSLRVTGSVPRAWKGRKVVLQRKHRDGWKRAGGTKVKKNGSFAITARSNWIHSLPYRVRTVHPKTGKALVKRRKLSAKPGWKPTGRPAAWNLLRTEVQGQLLTFRWNPCGPPLTYRVNLAQAKAGQNLADVKRAFGQVSLATGVKFKYLGTTNAHGFGAAHTPARPNDTDIVVSWTRRDQLEPGQQARFHPNSSTIGVGGLYGLLTRDARGPVLSGQSGSVAMRTEWNWQNNRKAAYLTLLHELGHVMGVGHVSNDHTQLMNDTITYQTPSRWGAGDLRALARVGYGEGCIAAVNSGGAKMSVPGDDHTDTDGRDPVLVQAVLP